MTKDQNKKTLTLWFCFLAVAVFALVFRIGLPFMVLSTFAYLTLTTGLILRKTKLIHYKLMGLGIALDVGVGLVLEVQRHAIHTALEFSLGPLQQGHIFASTVATVMFIPIVILGVRRLKGSKSERFKFWHIRLGLTAFAFRTIGFILMFSVVGRNH